MSDNRVIVLSGDNYFTNILYNALVDESINVDAVFIEKKESRTFFFKRRIKKLGLTKVFGQLMFLSIIPPLLLLLSQNRRNDIVDNYKLDDSEIPKNKIINIESVNSKLTIDAIVKMDPDLIILNGTRILSESLLNKTDAKIINMHAGITPKYRGVHGGYWSLFNKDRDNFGVTIHLVDKGVDTGNILAQKIINTSKSDNFATYSLLQFAEGLELLVKVTKKLLKKSKISFEGNPIKESSLYYHPTLIEYIKGLIKGVK